MQMQDASPASVAAVTALLSMRHGTIRYAEPPVSYPTPPALDLCIRRRPRTPTSSPEGARYLHHTIDSTPTTTTRSPSRSLPHRRLHSETSDETSSSSASVDTSTPLPSSSTAVHSRLKPTRPFKLYPKDPLVFSLGMSGPESPFGTDSSSEAYAEFRDRMLSQVKGNRGVVNKNMRRSSLPANAPEDPSKNEIYWEKRRKNNEAAKRSRDARRVKEDEIAVRAAYLERQNLKLKYEVIALRDETARLRRLVYNVD